MLSESRTVDKVVFARLPEEGFDKNPPIKQFFPSVLLKLSQMTWS